MGKILRGIAAALALVLAQNATAIEPSREFISITLKIGASAATVDGKAVKLSVATETSQGTTFIFCADLGKLLGIKFPWSPSNKMAGGVDILTQTSLSFSAGSDFAAIDGDRYKMLVKPYIKAAGKSQFFMVPLRFCVNVFGCELSVDKDKNISIKKPLQIPRVDWSTEGRDAGRRSIVPAGSAPKGQVLINDWKLGNGDEETLPIYFDGKMLMNDKSGWTCYDAAKKSVLWKIDNKADSIGNHFLLSQMFYCKGIVISGIGPTAYDAQTGKTVWQKNETGIGEGFVVNDIFLSWKAINPDDSKTRYAISGFKATDGLLAWKIYEFETPPRACWASCNKDRFLIKNVCFEYSTGKKLFELRDMPKYNAKTMFDDSGNIIAYSASGIHLYDGKTGNLIKSRNLGLSKNVVSFNSRIYCFNRETSSLLCLNPKTLETQWSVKADAADDCMIVASGYNLVLVSRKGVSGYGCGSGKLLWTRGDEKLLDIRKTSYYAIVDRHIYATTLDWSFQTFTRRLSIAP